MRKKKSKHLNAEQLAYIEAHYPNESNEQIAETLGLSKWTIKSRAEQYGWHKSKEYIKNLNRERAIQYENYKRVNTPEAHTKAQETRKKLYEKERLRLKWGLEQKTKRHFRTEPVQKLLQRNRLQRQGYIIDEKNLIAYYTDKTKRCPRLEAIPRGVKKGTIKPYYSFEQWKER